MNATSELIKCASCGASNRVSANVMEAKRRVGQVAVCGRCKTPLQNVTGGPSTSAPVIFTDANFASLAEQSTLPVLVDLWAPWCGPCRMVAPIVEQIAAEYQGRLVVGKLNVDNNPVTASRFNARSIPTLLLLNNGREVDRIVGAVPKPEMLRHIAGVLAG